MVILGNDCTLAFGHFFTSTFYVIVMVIFQQMERDLEGLDLMITDYLYLLGLLEWGWQPPQTQFSNPI